ncbi:DNA alkylation repair protein [Undibacterium terreum]|nr:DNA alkylation repair protein [Undibacterium terreum]
MSTSAICNAIQLALEPWADPARAQGMAAYMKGHFSYMGIATPQRRAAVAAVMRELKSASAKELLAIADALWRLPHREYQYVAIDILSKYSRSLGSKDVPHLLTLAQKKSWWDSVDGLSGAIRDILQCELPSNGKVQVIMDEALEHSDLWVRRIAMIHQLGWRDDTNTERLFRYAKQLAHEQEFFIRKAIGWALRDYAWHDAGMVAGFLEENKAQLSALTYREAGKHLERLQTG